MDMNNNEKRTIGSEATVRFTRFNKDVTGKVDTGATTSSLHATRISLNSDGSQVQFLSPCLSNNMVTLDITSKQEVHSADGGGNTRPVITLDIEIDGTPLTGVEFNLNDRSGMDSQILIGTNIIEAGNFVVDIHQDNDTEQPTEDALVTQNDTNAIEGNAVDREAKIREAVEVLRNSNVTLEEMVMYLKNEAITKLS